MIHVTDVSNGHLGRKLVRLCSHSILCLCTYLAIPPQSICASDGLGDTSQVEVSLEHSLNAARALRLSQQSAHALSLSVPLEIAQHIATVDPEYLQVLAACLPMADTTHDRHGRFQGQRICVFTRFDEELYVAVTDSGAGDEIVWDTTYQFGLPQPKLWRMTLGFELDTAVAIGMVGIVSPSGHKGYLVLLWNGRVGRLIASTNGLTMTAADTDHDGVAELIVEQEDENHPDRATGHPTLMKNTWKYDPAMKRYRQDTPQRREVPR